MKIKYIEFLLNLFVCVHEHIYLCHDAFVKETDFTFILFRGWKLVPQSWWLSTQHLTEIL